MAVFWNITPCSLGDTDWRFGGDYCLHLQGSDEYLLATVSLKERNFIMRRNFIFMEIEKGFIFEINQI